MTATKCREHAFGCNVIKTPKSGTALQFRKRHCKQQLGYALIGKRIAYDIYSCKVEYYPFVLFNQRKQLLAHTFT